MADEHLTDPKKCLTAFASVKTMLTLLYFVAQTLAQHFRIADGLEKICIAIDGSTEYPDCDELSFRSDSLHSIPSQWHYVVGFITRST